MSLEHPLSNVYVRRHLTKEYRETYLHSIRSVLREELDGNISFRSDASMAVTIWNRPRMARFVHNSPVLRSMAPSDVETSIFEALPHTAHEPLERVATMGVDTIDTAKGHLLAIILYAPKLEEEHEAIAKRIASIGKVSLRTNAYEPHLTLGRTAEPVPEEVLHRIDEEIPYVLNLAAVKARY